MATPAAHAEVSQLENPISLPLTIKPAVNKKSIANCSLLFEVLRKETVKLEVIALQVTGFASPSLTTSDEQPYFN